MRLTQRVAVPRASASTVFAAARSRCATPALAVETVRLDDVGGDLQAAHQPDQREVARAEDAGEP